MCWNVDVRTNVGACVALCDGSPEDPTCEEAAASCVIANEGSLNLCLPFCDPLLQDCDDGQACYPVNTGFFCAPDASLEAGGYGEECQFINVCDPGLHCATPDAVSGCAFAGCCTTFCDLSDPMASANCPDAADGQECVAWYAEGTAPAGFENVGTCTLPS